MVYEATDNMSAIKKLSLRKSIKSPFGGKSGKKTARSNSTDDNIVVGDDCAVVGSSPLLDEITPVVKGKSESETDAQSRPVGIKGFSKKSYKWPFRRRRSDDNGNAEFEPKMNLYEATEDNGKPGSTWENDGELNETIENGVLDDSSTTNGSGSCVLSNQCIPPSETGNNHMFLKNGKVVGYVVPVRRQQEHPPFPGKEKVADSTCSAGENMQVTSLVSGCLELEGDASQERQDESDATGEDLNGNPTILATVGLLSNEEGRPEEKADAPLHFPRDRYTAPELPLPLKNRESEPELPPRPPKPASLRYKPEPEPSTSFSAAGDEPKDEEMPPRPPARPKNRTLGGGSFRPWNNLVDDSKNNRATVYETISLEPKEASLAKELAKLPRQPWYWGPLTQVQAEEKLATLPDGSFLVRDSSDERYLLSLSFNSHGRTLHTRIEHRNSLFSLNDSDGHSSVVELIECAVKESRNGVYGYMRDALGLHSFPARLTNWVSRYTEMRSLQHLCRFLIREVYPRHHIQRLPLPKKIKEYILENQY